jgi:hypothetical protein
MTNVQEAAEKLRSLTLAQLIAENTKLQSELERLMAERLTFENITKMLGVCFAHVPAALSNDGAWKCPLCLESELAQARAEVAEAKRVIDIQRSRVDKLVGMVAAAEAERDRLKAALLHLRTRIPKLVTWWQADPDATHDFTTMAEGIDAALAQAEKPI